MAEYILLQNAKCYLKKNLNNFKWFRWDLTFLEKDFIGSKNKQKVWRKRGWWCYWRKTCLNNCVHLIIFKFLSEHLEIITIIKDIAICMIVDGILNHSLEWSRQCMEQNTYFYTYLKQLKNFCTAVEEKCVVCRQLVFKIIA